MLKTSCIKDNNIVQPFSYNDIKQFNYWWNISTDWVEEPNYRRGGKSGVLRFKDETEQVFYIKCQENHIYHSLLHPLGQPTIKREYLAYQRFNKAQITTPKLIFCGQLGTRSILVTKELNHFTSLETWLSTVNQATRQTAMVAILTSIAKQLAKLHLNCLQHNCIYPKHKFINCKDIDNNKDTINIAFIDLEKSRKRLTAKRAALHDTPQIRRHTQLTDEEWLYFIKAYEQAFGTKLPALYLQQYKA